MGKGLLVPPPLCSVVDCRDDVGLDTAMSVLESEGGLIRLGNIFAVAYERPSPTPSMISDYEFCPRLVWVQTRMRAKLLTRTSLVSLVRGRMLHERYERYLSSFPNVITEYKVETDIATGVVDIVIQRGDRLIPVELKTGYATRSAHRKQLQIYMELLGSDRGYLVYRHRVETVQRDPESLKVLDAIRRVMSSERPPNVDRDKCSRCPFKKVCWSGAATGSLLSLWL